MQEFRELIAAFSLEVPSAGIPALQNDWFVKNVSTKKRSEEEKLIAGSYAHPDLIPHIAGWVSPSFQLKANRAVMEGETGNSPTIEQTMARLLKENKLESY